MPCSLTHLWLTQRYIEKSEKKISEIEQIQLIIWSILPDVLKNLWNNRNNSHFCWDQKQREISLDKLIENFIDVNWKKLNYIMLSYLFHLIIDYTWVPWKIDWWCIINRFVNENEKKLWRGIMTSNDKKFFSELPRKIQQ